MRTIMEEDRELWRALARFYIRATAFALEDYNAYLKELSALLGARKKRVYNYYYNLSLMDETRRIKTVSLHYYKIPRLGSARAIAEKEGAKYCLCEHGRLRYGDGLCYFCHVASLLTRASKFRKKKKFTETLGLSTDGARRRSARVEIAVDGAVE